MQAKVKDPCIPLPLKMRLHPAREKAPEIDSEASIQNCNLVMIPVAIVVPAVVAAVPPSVIPAEAAFALGIQVPPPLIRLPAAFAVSANRLIQF